MKLKNQAGFSVVEGVLLIVIICAVGGVAFFVYGANKTTNDTLKNSSSVTSPKFTPSGSSAPKDTTSTPPYFEIKELGIEFPVPPSLNDLTYDGSQVTAGSVDAYGSTQQSVELTTKSLSKISDDCSASKGHGFGGVVVGTGIWPPTQNSNANMAPLELEKQLKTNWVAYVSPQWACSSNKNVLNILDTDSGALRSALQSAQPIR